jgi:hypothetical protein
MDLASIDVGSDSVGDRPIAARGVDVFEHIQRSPETFAGLRSNAQ